MTVPYEVKVAKNLTPDEKKVCELIIQKTFEEINIIYNKWNAYSEVAHFNAAPAHQPISLSPQLNAFLQKVNTLVLLTGGNFDPTVEGAQKIWKEHLKKASIPSLEEQEIAKNSIGWHLIQLEPGYATKLAEHLEIDLGGVVKGYAIDLIAERLESAGFSNIYVDWGGDILAKGTNPSNKPWTVAIYPLDGNQPPKIVELKNQAIATSGDYLQYYEVTNAPDESSPLFYTHILNPKTGEPLKIEEGSVATFTAIAPTCMLADALATTGMILKTKSDNYRWIRSVEKKHPQTRFFSTWHTAESLPQPHQPYPFPSAHSLK